MITTRQPELFDRTPSDPSKTFGEFFAGIGLARMGLEQAGWSVAFANDIDPRKAAMYAHHFGAHDHFALAKRPDQVPDFTLAHASFPCTDLSLAGGRKGLDAGQSSAFWGFHDLLAAKGDARPPLVLLENVTGFLSSNKGRDFAAALEALAALGYAADAFILDAAHFVPQSRPRLFVIAQPAHLETGAANLEPCPLRPPNLVRAIRAIPTVPWAIRKLPTPPPYAATKLHTIVERVHPDDPQWWSPERADYLLNQMSDKHRATANAMIAAPRRSYGTVFRRVRNARSMAELRTDGLAGCLRTPKGGSGRQILFQAGQGEYRVRLLNPTECARLMGADGYALNVRPNQALFGFGDAVCVNAIHWIAENYLNRVVARTPVAPK